ncbi:uncharacterized protein MELLADRAFT_76523 [Melampsora larici-populina 98AG31]|uniref:Uncharacterized protein n=1 Tax=Melampsora larici-populina (strain 98AG31 / pathotype 3-4-7) TaxID=747676 RepID=F4R590_MELLP|nr:uncharacterized protein MELLADRAFT_76523 [Melampsora larici-populina 98AG31]EGG12304.1 hypothetical protein MELLADRAFT_76523 [Melampsora larici-populina 98AG31]
MAHNSDNQPRTPTPPYHPYHSISGLAERPSQNGYSASDCYQPLADHNRPLPHPQPTLNQTHGPVQPARHTSASSSQWLPDMTMQTFGSGGKTAMGYVMYDSCVLQLKLPAQPPNQSDQSLYPTSPFPPAPCLGQTAHCQPSNAVVNQPTPIPRPPMAAPAVFNPTGGQTRSFNGNRFQSLGPTTNFEGSTRNHQNILNMTSTFYSSESHHGYTHHHVPAAPPPTHHTNQLDFNRLVHQLAPYAHNNTPPPDPTPPVLPAPQTLHNRGSSLYVSPSPITNSQGYGLIDKYYAAGPSSHHQVPNPRASTYQRQPTVPMPTCSSNNLSGSSRINPHPATPGMYDGIPLTQTFFACDPPSQSPDPPLYAASNAPPTSSGVALQSQQMEQRASHKSADSLFNILQAGHDKLDHVEQLFWQCEDTIDGIFRKFRDVVHDSTPQHRAMIHTRHLEENGGRLLEQF